MKITAVDALALGYRKTDPPKMARNFAVVRIETDAGLVGWARRARTGATCTRRCSWRIRDVCAAPLLGTDPADVQAGYASST